MKTALILLLTSSLSLFASPYWVQVSSIKTSKDVSPHFLKQIKQNNFEYKILETPQYKQVCLGPFKSQKEAQHALPKIRCKIAHDAFIRGENIAKTAPKAVAAKTEIVKEKRAELASLPQVTAPKPCLCIYDEHLLHKMEIDRAVAYYKDSSYYSFKK
jgi:hypothetical protein